MAERITTKKRMYELQRQHRLGNCLRTWDWNELPRPHVGRDSLSIRGKRPGMEFVHHVERWLLPSTVTMYCHRNMCSARDIVISESDFAGGRCIIQGEVTRDEHGLLLYYSVDDVNMRQAAAKGWRIARGLWACGILHEIMSLDESSELVRLVDEWADHVVEFTLFTHRLGWCHERLVIWEVRAY